MSGLSGEEVGKLCAAVVAIEGVKDVLSEQGLDTWAVDTIAARVCPTLNDLIKRHGGNYIVVDSPEEVTR